MKKSLSLLVAIAMVFSMFATVVSAAGPAEGQSAGEYLNELGVIKGNGVDLKEDQTWKRQDIVVLLSRLLGVEDEAASADTTHEFTDVNNEFYDGYISWAVEEGLVQGKGNGVFGYNDELKFQEFYALVLRAFKLEIDYDDVPATAVELGLASEDVDFAAIPTRGNTYDTVVEALFTVVPGTGRTLGEILGLIEITDLAISSVTQTNKGEITVSFNKAATEEEQEDLTATVKNGAIEYNVTSAWAEDGRALVLTSTYLPAAVYTVTVGEFAPVEVTIVNEVPTKLEIGATTLQKAAGQDLKVKLYNQFNKEIENPALTVSVFNSTYGKAISVSAGKVDLSSDEVARVNDVVIVSASHAATGLNASKSFEVVAGSSATVITLSAPTPVKDETRISVDQEGIVLPYTLTDQYGGSIKLAETSGYQDVSTADKTVTLSGITFLVSDTEIVTAFAVDSDGVLTLRTGSKHGNVVVNAMNTTVAGVFASISFNVSSKADVKTLTLQPPASLVAGNEEFTVPYSAVDTFDQPIAAKDFSLDNLTFTPVGATFATGYPKLDAKGELKFKFNTLAADTTVYVYVGKDGAGQIGTQQFTVRKDATVEKINGLNIAKNFAKNGQVTLSADQITYRDSYGRTQKVANFSDVTINVVYTGTGTQPLTYNDTTHVFSAHASATGEVTVEITHTSEANSKESFKINVIADSSVTSYSIKSIGTLYAGDAPVDIDPDEYVKTVELVGRTSGNAEVVIDQATAFDFVSSASPSIVKVDVTDVKSIQAVDAGTAVISAWKGDKKLAEVEVTASKAAPVATTVSFENGEYTLVAGATNFAGEIKVKDQYGVVLTAGRHFAGFLSSSNSDVASVTGTNVTSGVRGSATLTYTTTTGASATTVVYVE